MIDLISLIKKQILFKKLNLCYNQGLYLRAEVAMLKRIFTFLALNFVIVLTISLILQLLNVKPYLNAYGLNYESLAVFCLVWGMVGALISLALSRKMAKWMLHIHLVDSKSPDNQSKMIFDMVARISQRAGLPDIPEVGIFESNELNAFATGPTKRRSLVALSRGLINTLSKEEIEAVIAHEVSHIVNGDMVTMTLLQGVVNAFVMFLSRVVAFLISGFGRDRERGKSGSYMSYVLCTFVFEIIFMILGSMIVAYFSRRREYRADRGSADLLGKAPMINALRRLERQHEMSAAEVARSQNVDVLMIARPGGKRRFFELFGTHPSIKDRIERLEQL